MVGFTDRQESVVSNWRKNVVTKLGEEMFLLFDQPSTLIGSYDRDTITKSSTAHHLGLDSFVLATRRQFLLIITERLDHNDSVARRGIVTTRRKADTSRR